MRTLLMKDDVKKYVKEILNDCLTDKDRDMLISKNSDIVTEAICNHLGLNYKGMNVREAIREYRDVLILKEKYDIKKLRKEV